MDPGTMAMVAMGASIAGKAVSAAGDLFGGAATSKMYEFQAGMAQARSRIDEQNAIFAGRAGEETALNAGLRGRFAGGVIKAGQGASNVDVNRGSAPTVRAGETMITQMNESQIRTNAARKAFGYRVEEATDIAQAGQYSTASATARTASYYAAAGSILGGAGSVADKWSQYSANFGDNPQNQMYGDTGMTNQQAYDAVRYG